MTKWKRASAVAIGAAIALAGCSAGTSEGDDAPTTLTIGAVTPIATFQASEAAWANQAPFLEAVYDTLLRTSPTGEIEPGLATEWSYDDALTELTLTLRDDVEFTDGSAFTAEVAAQNVLRFRDGTAPNASHLAGVVDAVAADETTLVITLDAPNPALLTYLSQAAGLQASAETFVSPDAATDPVGSGPYVLDAEETVVGTSYVFDANPDYWDPESQHYDTLVLNVYADGTALLNAIQGGQVNASNTFDNTTLSQIESAGWTVHAGDVNWNGLILFDRDGVLNPALGDVRVRQAINYAFDREALLEALGQGYGTVTEQIFPPSSSSFDEALDETYGYDPEQARELLAEAGYADGFTLRMPSTNAISAATFTLVAQQLADVGITVEYTDLVVADFISDILAAEYEAASRPLAQDPTDWQLVQLQVSAAATWNVFDVTDETVEGYVQAIRTGTADEAEEAGAELNAYLVEQAWYAPFYRPQASFVTDAATDAVRQVGTNYPALRNITPAE